MAINASVTERLMAFDGFDSDWSANTLEDGSGTDATGDYTVTADAFASTVKLTITNTGGSTSWLSLRVRGRGVYDLGPFTVEAIGTSGSDRELEIDQRYQDDPNVAQDIADFVLNQYETLMNQGDTLEIWPEKSNDFMLQAMMREPDDLIVVSEEVTGLSHASFSVNQVRIGVMNGRWLTLEFGVAPNVVGDTPWILGTSQLGIDTVLGFA